ncbi:DEAD/DEAH box helicase family protein, partial [Piscibacillus sp. B03]|uniref:DEAD/DEAH box helicase family protein n=1 Tax=Piscibacillus sp. B03 TaxID=3457430 RepID=UPI003FCC5A0D
MAEKILHQQIKESMGNVFNPIPEIPNYIADNLHFPLRPYQTLAMQHLIFFERSNQMTALKNHLLFHMATGSGKTLVLAAALLYYYKEYGYQNVLFFVNSDAIIRKTKENLTNTSSSKYLFDPEGIEIDGQQITIQLVDVFPSIPDENTIYLKLSSIQKLHQIEQPRENGLTYESLAEHKTLLLSDEAHHINVETRQKKKKLTKKETEERNWERTVTKILNSHPENKMLEFTATLDLTNHALFEKYRDKVVFQYDLRSFMMDGYSKNVFMVKANNDDQDKMIEAVLLSQYRKYIALEIDVELKPIILFKSNDIKTSTKMYGQFFDILTHLSVERLNQIIKQGFALHEHEDNIWQKMYHFYLHEKDTRELLQDIHYEFQEQTVLKVDSKDLLSEENAVLLNTLEEPNNPIRAVFAVSKLNEGWDVLNLFDIVRISEKAGTGKGATDSEAQLIGRGARYNPFNYDGFISDKRRFDTDHARYRVLESLHYHTINEHKYIQNLKKSLDKEGVVTREDRSVRFEAKVKKTFKDKPLFKQGKIYINDEVETSA